ncbi:MAG TPA: FtsX-like permease family protein [Thermoleophilia bacterium]|nr:FtsX-like permease family protein [Thermoleophilia bacterium]
MIRLALRDLWSRKLRTVLTMLAIVLGVAMIAGTYVITDQIDNGFHNIFEKAAVGTDVNITRKAAFGNSLFQGGGSLPVAMLDQVKAVSGVAAAAGTVEGSGAVVVNGKAVSTNGAPTLVFSTSPQRFSRSTYVAGARPSQDGTVAVNTKLASDKHLHVGDQIGLGTEQGVQPVTIAGIFNFGDSTSIGGATLVATTLADAQRWYNLEGQYSTIEVAAEPGVTPDTLAARLKAALPHYADVKTSAQSVADNTKAISDAIGSVLRTILLAFGGVAVIVGAFIIFNAFSITVAQRIREFAMLRSLGATRRQVLASVIGEAGALGLIASLLGIAAGIGIAKGINALFHAVGADIPTSGIALAPRTIIVSLVVGIGVALVAALGPALRATRVPPVAALHEGATLPPSAVSRYSAFIAVLAAVVGAAALAAGMFVHGPTSSRLLEMALGAVLIFVAVAMVAKHIVRPLASVLGWPAARFAGSAGRLARENATRNPARTAATAAALMIGLAVVVFVAVFAQGFKTSFVSAIDQSVNAQIVVSGTGGGSFPAAALDAVKAVPNVDQATGIYTATAKIDGRGTTAFTAVDPVTFGPMWHFHWLKGGSAALLGHLTDNAALVEEQFAAKYDLSKGKSFVALGQAGAEHRFTVIGEYRDPTLLTGFTVAQSAFDRLVPSDQRDPLYIIATTSANPDQTKAAVTSALTSFPTTKVQTKAEYTASVKKQVDQLLTLIYALLAVSVIISIFGIVNTLVLSVYERTREIGMLRAIGTTRRQMRRIVRYESVITSVIGGILGTILGVLFAYVVSTRLASQGITFSVPWGQLVVFLIVAAIVGVVAAVLPAHRASRVNILDAIHYE